MMVEDRRSTGIEPEYDPETGAYHVRYEPTDAVSLEVVVIRAVAAVAGVRETALGDVLHDRVDPDALGALFEPTERRRPTASAGVWFTLAGHRVAARADGLVAIYPPDGGYPDVPLGPGPEP